MSSIAQRTKRSKKTKRLGPVRLIPPKQYEAFDVSSKMECIRALIPLGLMRIQELLEEEVCALAGERYARKAAQFPGRRHGSNPGSVIFAITTKMRASSASGRCEPIRNAIDFPGTMIEVI